MNITVVLSTMLQLFFILVIGYAITKMGMMNEETSHKLSSFVVNITMPAIIIASVCSNLGQGDVKEVLNMFLAGAVTYLVLPVAAFLGCKLIGVKKPEMGTYQFMIIFSNCTFMGYPVMEAIFGSRAIFLSSIFNLPFNLLAFSYGIFLIAKDGEEKADFQWKKLLNPGIISSILALLIYVLNIQLPSVLVDTMSMLGNVTTPLSMIVLGIFLAQVPLKKVFGELRIYPLTILRLLVLPIIGYFVLGLFTKDDMIIGIGTMTLAMPVASMTVMLSSQYKGKVQLASVGVFITTLCSVITIPFVAWLLFS